MNKILLEVVFSVILMLIFTAGSALPNVPDLLGNTPDTSSPDTSMPNASQEIMICTPYDLLVQKIDNAYHTQFKTSCDPVNFSGVHNGNDTNPDNPNNN